MSDPRLTPQDELITQDLPARVSQPVADLLRTPFGNRDRQLLQGEALRILGQQEGHFYVQSQKDGYLGFVINTALGPDQPVSHVIQSRATHAYREADMKSPELVTLSHGSFVQVLGTSKRFYQTSLGYIPQAHLRPIEQNAPDIVATAELFLGTPYLWGGNSAFGIDCSGLVQAALSAAGIACPGDSDLQQKQLGEELAPESDFKAGDLLFWKGHIAMAVDEQTLIHANAHHMACVYEPIQEARARILSQGDGPMTAHKRLFQLSKN